MKKQTKTILLALLVMALWGSLFPCVKLGYKVFNIASNDIPQILMFAGVRFFMCGLIISIFSWIRKKDTADGIKKGFMPILLTGLFSIILHYTCTYICLSFVDSSKTAILKQLGALFYICFGFLFIKDEKFSVYKIIGAVLGFCGIIAINLNGTKIGFGFGDILIILASICTVAGSLASKKGMQFASPIAVTGISQLFGGIVLIAIAKLSGAKSLAFTASSLPVFTYICFASIISYCLWNYIIKTSELSNMFIVKFSEPLFACVFSAMLLNENIFKWQYLAAFALISLGISMQYLKKSNE